MIEVQLSTTEQQSIRGLLAEVATRHDSVEDSAFLDAAPLMAHELPRRLRSRIHAFKIADGAEDILLVSNFPVDDAKVGHTPAHWQEQEHRTATFEEEAFFVLCGSLLGDVFGWSTQQDAHMIHEVCPIKEYETSQQGFSSQQYLEWHTEDAFHPFRADYVGLMCLRNPGQTPTLVASVSDLDLSDEDRKILFQPLFTIRPDLAHLDRKYSSDWIAKDDAGKAKQAYALLDEMEQAPKKIAVLFGDPAHPFLRLDPLYMDTPEDERARRALHNIVEQVKLKIKELALRPGDVCFMDNYKVVHGRSPFKANYDGKDRWLKRTNITRNLRMSRTARASATSRVII